MPNKSTYYKRNTKKILEKTKLVRVVRECVEFPEACLPTHSTKANTTMRTVTKGDKRSHISDGTHDTPHSEVQQIQLSVVKPIEKIIIIIMNFTLVI